MLRTTLLLAVIVLSSVSAFAKPTPRFEGDVKTTWLDHNKPEHKAIMRNERDMQLTAPFKFVDKKGKEWSVPKDFVVDGASIPKLFWTVMGSPYTGRYRRASVVHDYYCRKENRHLAECNDVHDVFYEAMVCDGVNKPKAWTMSMAVRPFNIW